MSDKLQFVAGFGNRLLAGTSDKLMVFAGAEGGIREFGAKYAVARDADASVARAYKAPGTPTIVFPDWKGIVRYFANELPEDYARRLNGLLADF